DLAGADGGQYRLVDLYADDADCHGRLAPAFPDTYQYFLGCGAHQRSRRVYHAELVALRKWRRTRAAQPHSTLPPAGVPAGHGDRIPDAPGHRQGDVDHPAGSQYLL